MDNERVGEVLVSLGRLEGKLDGVLIEQKRMQVERGSDNVRLSKVEETQARMVGYALGAGAVGGLLIAFLGIIWEAVSS